MLVTARDIRRLATGKSCLVLYAGRIVLENQFMSLSSLHWGFIKAPLVASTEVRRVVETPLKSNVANISARACDYFFPAALQPKVPYVAAY